MKSRLSFRWLTVGFLLAASFIATPTRAQLPNAWQITDNSQTASAGSYSTNLGVAQRDAALTNGWRYSVKARFLDDYNDSATMLFYYVLGTNRFSVYWDLDGNNDLTAMPYNQSTITLTTNGTGTNFYHTYDIVYDPNTNQAAFLFDGILRASWGGDEVKATATNGAIVWGSGSMLGRGKMNFQTVAFFVGTNLVAAYNAGNSPTNAPDPRTQSWAVSAGTASTNAISPDAAALTPASPVTGTLPVTGALPHGATISGTVNPGGLGVNAWLEWGTTTNYGNLTRVQLLKGGTNAIQISQLLTGLANGATYHFLCAATNLLGAYFGDDVAFTTPATISVTSLANSGAGSLRQAIADAEPDDTITFATNGTLTLTGGQLSISKNLSIVGPGPGNLRLDGNNDDRVFQILNGATGSISGLTIQNGHAPNGSGGGGGADGLPGASGGGVYNSGTLVLSNCVITGNRAGNGGNGSHPAPSSGDGTGGNGGAGGNGGGVYNSGFLALISCTVSTNLSGNGGNGGDGSDGYNFLWPNGHLGGNGGNAGGGGGVHNSGSLILVDCLILKNKTGDGGDGGDGGNAAFSGWGGYGGNGGNGGLGGGLFSTRSAVVTNCVVQINTIGTFGVLGHGGTVEFGGPDGLDGYSGARGYGGGALNDSESSGTLTITRTAVTGNSAPFGGGILNFSGSLELSDSTFTSNSVTASGGAIYLQSGAIALSNCTFTGNSASWGGGIVNFGALLTLASSTFVGNSATNYGGGVENSSGTNFLNNCTFNANSADFGGGLHNYSGVFALNSSTLTGNSANSGGGISQSSTQTDLSVVANSIVAGNAASGATKDIGGAQNHLSITGSLTNGNPLLAPLGNYGGPTQTMPPLAGSPAIDAGLDSVTNSLAADQRGYPRRSGARVDIGAVELQAADPNHPPVLTQPYRLAGGALTFNFANGPGITFKVFASTNVALPLNLWTNLGLATQGLPGQYQFTDARASNYSRRFYQVRSP